VAHGLNLKTEASLLGDDISELLVVENKRGAIGYNSTHARVRQRFTVAHEIGHYVMHVKNSAHSRLFIDRYVAFRDDDSSGARSRVRTLQPRAGEAVYIAAVLLPELLSAGTFLGRARELFPQRLDGEVGSEKMKLLGMVVQVLDNDFLNLTVCHPASLHNSCC